LFFVLSLQLYYNLLTPRYIVFLKQLKVVQLVKKSHALMASKHFFTIFINTSPYCREDVSLKT